MSAQESVSVIAEVGVNHNGNFGLAVKLIEESVNAGANIVKFQTFDPSELTHETALTAPYQSASQMSQRGMLSNLTLSNEEFRQLARCTRSLGAEFLTTAFDVRSLHFAIEDLGIQRVKIPSGEITNPVLLHYAGKSGLPILLSTGMATASEISAAVHIIESGRKGIELKDIKSLMNGEETLQQLVNLTILHCISLYPCPPEDLNLRAMERFKSFVGCDLGLSDHTSSILAPALSVALGGSCVEKHITLDKKMDGPDHMASLEVSEFKEMVALIREAEVLLGSSSRELTGAEIEMRQYARRGVYAGRNLASGDRVDIEDVSLSRPETQINAISLLKEKHFARLDIDKGHALGSDNLEVKI